MSYGISDFIKDSSPMWLKDGRAERFVFNIGISLDMILEKLTQASRMAMPTLCDASALPFIGQDVLIPPGLTETESSYRSHLQQAYDAWQIAGSDWSVLRWTLHRLLEMRPAARIVSNRYDVSDSASFPPDIQRTKWASYAAGDDPDEIQPVRELVEPGNWDWDSATGAICHGSWSWARTWVIVYAVAPHDFVHPQNFRLGDAGAPKLGDKTWSLGFQEPANTVHTLLDAIYLWKARHCQLVNLIITFDPGAFDPAEPSGLLINPDGTFGRWSDVSSGDYFNARSSITNTRYCARVD